MSDAELTQKRHSGAGPNQDGRRTHSHGLG